MRIYQLIETDNEVPVNQALGKLFDKGGGTAWLSLRVALEIQTQLIDRDDVEISNEELIDDNDVGLIFKFDMLRISPRGVFNRCWAKGFIEKAPWLNSGKIVKHYLLHANLCSGAGTSFDEAFSKLMKRLAAYSEYQ